MQFRFSQQPDQDAQSLLTYATFLLTLAFQCFVYCHGGARLETESVAVADALYAARWYVADVSTQKCVLMAIRRAQRSLRVRSVFFSANLETFGSVSKHS